MTTTKETKFNEIKNIDLTAKEWFDRANGNSYFSARLVLNYGMENERLFKIPFQYGYGQFYEQAALATLKKEFPEANLEKVALWHLKEQGIILRSEKIGNCLKKEAENFGK